MGINIFLQRAFILAIMTCGLHIPCMPSAHADLEAVVHHEGVRYVVEKIATDGDTKAQWYATDVVSAARKEIKIPADISGVVIAEGDRVYYLEAQKLVRMSLRDGATKVVASSLSGFLQDAYSYAGTYVLILADSAGWHYLRIGGAGKTLVSFDIPVVGNLLTSTVQSGTLVMSFLGENGIGVNFFRIDLTTDKLLSHNDKIVTLEDAGVDIWLTRVVLHHGESKFVCPFDSDLQYFKRYHNDYLICTSMRLYCISEGRSFLVRALNISGCTFDGEIILTANGPAAVNASGKVVFDLFLQPERQ